MNQWPFVAWSTSRLWLVCPDFFFNVALLLQAAFQPAPVKFGEKKTALRVEHRGLPEACRGRGPRASGPCHKVRDSGPNEACQSRARGPGGREHGEDAHFPRTRSVARSVQDRVARRYLVESTSGVHASTSQEGEFTFGCNRPLRHANEGNGGSVTTPA